MAHSQGMIDTRHLGAVIYDMDGVLIDSEPLHHDAELSACRAHGFTPPEETWKRIKGMRPEPVFEELKRAGGVTEPDVSVRIATYEAHFAKQLAARANPLPFALDVLKDMRRAYDKLALATSSPRGIQQATFAALGIDAATFDAIVTSEDVVCGKPAPDPYLLAAKRLGIEPHKCVVIEDSDNGIRSARAAGCSAIGITGTFTADVLYDAGAMIVCDSHMEIGFVLGR